jgi:PAS domain S-box-containing protein
MGGRMLYFNSVVTNRLGYTVNELLHEHVLKVHLPDKHEEATQKIEGMLRGDEEVCRVPLFCKDATEIPVETKVKKGTWSGKDVLIGISRDTTERRRYEKQIKQNAERLELALLASDAGLWDWNLKTNELVLNDKWFAMRGFEIGQPVNNLETWETLLHPDDKKATMISLNNHLENKTPFYQAEYRSLTKSGDFIWILDTGKIVEYDFEGKFRALVGKTNTSIQKELEDDFPHLPLGCTINLERKAKDFILQNIRNATSLNINQLLNKIRNFKYQTSLPLTLKNFSSFYHIPLQLIYKKGNWMRLCVMAEQESDYSLTNEKEIHRAISKKWLSCNSNSYFQFILSLAQKDFKIRFNNLK